MKNNYIKILMTTDTVGGVWTYTLELCKALQEEPISIYLAAMGGLPDENQENQVRQLPNVTLYKSKYKLEWMQDPWDDLRKAKKWITSIYHTVIPDIVHFNNYAQLENFWQAPIITVYHSCVETWWQAVKGTTAPSSWKRYMELVRDSLNASDVVVSPTRALLQKASEAHYNTTPSQVIANGHDPVSTKEIKKEKIIFCTGRIWDEAKNLQSLCNIAAALPWPVYVAGDDINPNTGEKAILDNVYFLGKLSAKDTLDWMRRASIFVSPTKYEPFGLAILEAALAGCALTISKLDTLEEVWEENAVFFDPDHPRETLQAIMQLIKYPRYLTKMAQKAQYHAQQYSGYEMGRNYLKLYQNLLATGRTHVEPLKSAI